MNSLEHFERFYYRNRSRWGRRRRLFFPSPLEMRLIEIMGGQVVRLGWLRDPRRQYPAAFVVRRGPIFGPEKVRREVRYGRYFVDFANDLNRIIEVDGASYHMDVVADMDREIYIKNRAPDCKIMRIKAYEIVHKPADVRDRIVRFLVG